MISAGPPPMEKFAELAKGYTEWDRKGMAGGEYYNTYDSGYSKIQGTKPQTIGTGLNDSPAGLLAWIVEKLRQWSDCKGDPENSFSKMEMITNVAMYWYGKAATSSARLYYEGPFGRGEVKASQENAKLAVSQVTIPFGFSLFPKEITWVPKSWMEYSYSDIRRFQIMPRGGHFAAFEEPYLMAKELEEFFMLNANAKALCKVGGSKL